ncbi:MAG: DUF1080 domain-containing protein [Planctomycetota bacterium]|jgi:hypothetical protein|nr:DUF1080 domain-containing protein [Planctomycetota bacterium]MDP6940676.1 DUF1080 domain-containing protein [Planctomycetota bacterium]
MKNSIFLLLLAAAVLQDETPPYLTMPAKGYADTPTLPGQKWKVHDRERPIPPFVGPAGQNLPLTPPPDATVLFDGSSLDGWRSYDNKAAKWKLVEGQAMEVNGTGDIRTANAFGDCQLHVEWMSPVSEQASQGASNSGVYMMGLYEIQVLDSWSSRTYPDGQAAALYGQHPPLVNASRKPGTWQSYDIIFHAPEFSGEDLVSAATITLFHNGVLVHDHQSFIGQTVHRKVATYQAHPEKLPLKLQDHGNPVRYRNIWVRPL